MAIVTKTEADGYFKVSEGHAQVQLRTTSETIGVIHSATAPATSDEPHFIVIGSGIEPFLGNTPCYVKVLSSGSCTYAYEDIS